MLLFITCLGIVPAAILFHYRGWRHLPSLFLALLFITLSACFYYWYGLIGASGSPSAWDGLLGGAVFLAGPALYGYTMGLSGRTPRPGRAVLHLLPALVYFLVLTPSGMGAAVSGWDGQVLPGLWALPPLPSTFVGPLFFLGYVLWAGGCLWQESGNKDRRRLTWHASLQLLLFIFAAATFLLGLEASGSGNGAAPQELEGAFSWVFLFNFGAISTLPFCFPEVLYGRAPFLVNGQPDLLHGDGEGDTRRAGQQFPPDYLLQLSSRVSTCMEQEKPYLDPRLNLVRFSVLTGIPAHHLAFYLRNNMEQSFTEYRNAWRVQYAKTLIAQGQAATMTLEAIGIQSGFSSRNAFLSAFKKHTGLSPRDFMLQCLPARK